MTPARRPSAPRLALRIEEAADAIGVSVDTFERHVQPSLRTIYVGRVRLFDVREVQRWLERQAVAPVRETGGRPGDRMERDVA